MDLAVGPPADGDDRGPVPRATHTAGPDGDGPADGEAAASPQRSEAGRVARDSLVLTSGLAVTWIVSFAIRLALPKFLDASTFGRLVFCESVALLLFAPLTLGIDTYARREVPAQPDIYRRIIRPVTATRGVVSALMTAAGLGALALLGRPSSVLMLFGCYAIAQFALNGGLISSAFLHGGGRAGAAATTQVVTKLLWAVLAVGGLALGGGPVVIPVALAASEGFRLVWLRRRNVRLFGAPQRSDWTVTKLALFACAPLAARQLSIALSNSLDTALVGIFAGDEEVALYGVATLIGMSVLFLVPALSAALLPALSRSRKTGGDDAVHRLGAGVLNLVVAVMAPLVTLLVLESDDVVVRLFGAQYLPAAPSLRVLALVFLLTYVAAICSTILIALGRTWPVTVASLASVAVNTVTNLVLLGPATRHLGAGGPSVVASWTVFAAEAISATAMLVLLGRRLLNGRLLAVVVPAAVGCAGLVVVHHTAGGGLRLLVIEAALALLLVARGARRPIRALRSAADTHSEQAAHRPDAAEDKDHAVVNSPG